MNPPRFIFIILASGWLARPAVGFAHGLLHDQIAAMNAEIEKQPANPELLLRRAELRRLHEEWDEAAHDIAAARDAGAAAGAVAFARARVNAGRMDWEAAARELPAVVKELPENVEGWRLAGAVQTARGQHAAAVAAWREAVAKADPARPDDCVFLARALHANGANDEAIAALDVGIRRIGELAVLIEEAAGIEEDSRRWDAALDRIARLVAISPNPARWLARRGDIAEKAGRPAAAEEARRAALAAIESLPTARRNTSAMSDLAGQLRKSLGISDTETPKD